MSVGFDIVTTVSPSYLHFLKLCTPSWYMNSGADKIITCTLPDGSWFKQLDCRTRLLCNVVKSMLGRKLLLLDVDCVVLKDLSEGFHESKPFSVARWPNINAGVIFVNTQIPFDFVGFLDILADRVHSNCYERKKNIAADQDIWQQMLGDISPQVCKLDWAEWNFCDHPQNWDKVLARCKDRVRIAHVKGGPNLRPKPLAALHKYFHGEF